MSFFYQTDLADVLGGGTVAYVYDFLKFLICTSTSFSFGEISVKYYFGFK